MKKLSSGTLENLNGGVCDPLLYELTGYCSACNILGLVLDHVYVSVTINDLHFDSNSLRNCAA